MERRRVPPQIVGLTFGSLAFGGTALALGAVSADPGVRVLLIAYGLVYLIPVIGLCRLRPWSRTWGVGLFIVVLAKDAILLSVRGVSGLGLVEPMFAVYALLYLAAPSTARLFDDRGGIRLRPGPGLVSLATIALIVASVVGLRKLGVPKWPTIITVAAVYVAGGVALGPRINRWVGARISPRPAELHGAQATAFVESRRALARGDAVRAQALAAELPECRGVTILRGLIAMSRTDDPLRRLIFDADYEPPADSRPAVAAACARGDAEPLAQQRAAFVDAVLEDFAADHSTFAAEFVDMLERLTGTVYMANEEARYRAWWSDARTHCTGANASRWLTVRLWEAQCPDAARTVADRSVIVPLQEIARVAVAVNVLAERKGDVEWVAANLRSIALLAPMAELGGLFRIDSPFAEFVGLEQQALHVRLRLPLIEHLRTTRDAYPEARWPRALLCILAATENVKVRSNRAFESWWARERPHQERFDLALACGIEAAARGKWADAERRFAEAEQAAPSRPSAPYNRGLALGRIGRDAEAEALFLDGARRWPDDAAWWTRVGDSRAKRRLPKDALEAYRAAVRIGGLEEELAVKIGTTYAMNGDEAAAQRTLDEGLTDKTDPQTLAEISSFLETQGNYRLALRYQEQAFYRSLTEPPPEDDEDREDAVGAS